MLGIGKLFGLGKKSDYFLEFDEGKGTTAAPPKPQPKSETPKSETPKSETPKSDKKQKTKKSTPKKSPEAVKAPPSSAPAPAPVVTKAPPPINAGIAKTPAGMTFATDYLLPKSTPNRRRPGPSMNMFRDMARQMPSR